MLERQTIEGLVSKLLFIGTVAGVVALQLGHNPNLPFHFESFDKACALPSAKHESIARFGEERLCEEFRFTYASYCRWDVAFSKGELQCKVNWAQLAQSRCTRR
jgi:hypothetical protein